MSGEVEVYDDFNDDRSRGRVIGSLASNGHRRLGVDVERVLSIDNGALRIAPLIEAGFGRAALGYGPFPKRAGQAFAVRILNGHNTAQAESLPDTFRERMELWLRGAEGDSRWLRMLRWLGSGRVLRTLRQFRWWKRAARNGHPVPPLNENLAVGWFPASVVPDPRNEGSGFIMHALGPENGELWVGGQGSRTRSLRGVQNLPLYLVSILRPEGIIYYISSLDGAPGMGSHPQLTPLGVDEGFREDALYVAIQQSVLGQIGWRLDTRIEGVRVASVEGYETWCGGAVAADRLIGEGNLHGAHAEIGGDWVVAAGKARRGGSGAFGAESGTMAVLDPKQPVGLVHALAKPGDGEKDRIGLLWRFLDADNHWRLELAVQGVEAAVVVDGQREVLATKEICEPDCDRAHRLQVLDHGGRFMAYVDGEPVLERYIEDTRFEGARNVGILLGDAGKNAGTICSFEAHPREIRIPEVLDMGAPWLRLGSRIALADDFTGSAEDLDGRMTPLGGKRWTKVIGTGVVELTGNGGARIRASVEKPCPDRTAYCLEWDQPDFADLEVTVTPPGSERGQKHRCTAGFILYQDPDNYMTLNVWRADYYGGASISTFFKFDGFEDLYDAIWTNVGDRITYGSPSSLRISCDGERYLAFVNDEPVLYRAFRDVYSHVKPLRIRKVGLLANWEFGTDTGSLLEHFKARI